MLKSDIDGGPQPEPSKSQPIERVDLEALSLPPSVPSPESGSISAKDQETVRQIIAHLQTYQDSALRILGQTYLAFGLDPKSLGYNAWDLALTHGPLLPITDHDSGVTDARHFSTDNSIEA